MRSIKLFTRYLKGWTAAGSTGVPDNANRTVEFTSEGGFGWRVSRSKPYIPPNPEITLGEITFTPDIATPSIDAELSGVTQGSLVSATSSDGATVVIQGGRLQATFLANGTVQVTITETLDGATNSPRQTVRTVAVSGVPNPPVSRLVANRGETPHQKVTTIAAQTKQVSRTRHTFGGQNVTEMRLVFCGFFCSGSTGEQFIGSTQTVVASVEMNGVVKRVKFGGADSGTIPNGAPFYDSDLLFPSDFGLSVFPANGQFWVKDEREVPTGGGINKCGSAGALSGEGNSYAPAGTATQVDNPGALTATGGWTLGGTIHMPVAYLGKTVAPEISYVFLGDSIDNKLNDLPGDGLPDYLGGGMWVRAAGQVNGRAIPYVNMGNPSERVYTFNTAAGNLRRALLAHLGVTHMTVGFATNDMLNITGNRTAAATLAELQTVWSYLRNTIGVSDLRQRLVIPATTSASNQWLGGADQTPYADYETGGAKRDALNNGIIANFAAYGLDGYIDVNSAMADAAALDRWKSTGANRYGTIDGIHPNGVLDGQAALIIRQTMSAWTPKPF